MRIRRKLDEAVHARARTRSMESPNMIPIQQFIESTVVRLIEFVQPFSSG